MRTKKDKVIDTIVLTVMTLCVALLIVDIPAKRTIEATCEPHIEPTTAETTEYINEPTETEGLTEEVTEPTEAVTLYNVPLDQELQLHIISEAEAHNIDPAIILAMAFRETTYRTDAIGDGGNSYGLLQIQPKWHRERMQRLGCTNLLDPYQNVIVGIDYLAENLNRYGSIEAALTAYNRGHYSGTVTSYAKDILSKAETIRSEVCVLFR